jgi:hypothetical protein
MHHNNNNEAALQQKLVRNDDDDNYATLNILNILAASIKINLVLYLVFKVRERFLQQHRRVERHVHLTDTAT